MPGTPGQYYAALVKSAGSEQLVSELKLLELRLLALRFSPSGAGRRQTFPGCLSHDTIPAGGTHKCLATASVATSPSG